jgi:hypothetical protein
LGLGWFVICCATIILIDASPVLITIKTIVPVGTSPILRASAIVVIRVIAARWAATVAIHAGGNLYILADCGAGIGILATVGSAVVSVIAVSAAGANQGLAGSIATNVATGAVAGTVQIIGAAIKKTGVALVWIVGTGLVRCAGRWRGTIACWLTKPIVSATAFIAFFH